MSAVEAAPRDIESRDDVVRLVDAFYARATTDPVIGHLFTEVARLDLEAHLPVMYDFWETLLLGVRTYRGNAMQKHVELHRKSPLGPEHFERWLALFMETVDGLFAGERARTAREKAAYIARSMQIRLSSLPIGPARRLTGT